MTLLPFFSRKQKDTGGLTDFPLKKGVYLLPTNNKQYDAIYNPLSLVRLDRNSISIDYHAKDSLLLQLKQTTIAAERINIYRNLADICFETPEEKTYLLNMYREAQKAGDTSGMLNALNDLVCGETKEYRMDSAYHYMELIKAIREPQETAPVLAYLQMRFFDTLCSHNETEEAITKELQFIEEKKSDEASLYSKIAQAYITGGSLHYNDMIKEALPIWKQQ